MIVTGALRPSDGGLVGPFTNQTIRQFKFDHAIIGCSVLVKKASSLILTIKRSRQVASFCNPRTSVLVADGQNFCAQRHQDC